MPPPTLLHWLSTLDTEALARCLRLRADVQWGVPVADLADLADRLEHPGSVSRAVLHLASPWLGVLEVLTALGDGASVDAAAGLLAGSARPGEHLSDVSGIVDGLVAAALVVPGKGGALGVNPGVREVFPAPLALAPPARSLLGATSASELSKLARRWGMDVAQRKAELVDAVAARLANSGHVRRLLGSAPPEVAQVVLGDVERALERARTALVAAGTSAQDVDDAPEHPFDPEAYRRRRAAWAWAVQHGLAYADEPYSASAVVPSEVILALAPPGFVLPFQPEPPRVPTAPVPAQRLASTSAGAVTEWLGTAMAVLELVARRPLAVLQSGGVGTREIQRMAKSVGATPADVRLVLEIATALRLLEVTERGLAASAELAGFRGATPARRADALLSAWLGLPTIPTVDRDADGRARPALLALDGVRDPAEIRVELLVGVADLAEGAGVASTDALVDLVRWRQPLAADPWSPDLVLRTWAEAGRLGVVADGACTDIGRVLLEGGQDELEAALTAVLPAVQTRALIGSDLTVVVPGSPDPAVVDTLDAIAVREARGAASTWRVTPASVRDALDSGLTVEAVRTALERIGGSLPQALDYLLRDVGRRHGHLRARPAAAVLTGEDVALLAEVAAHRSLRQLGLRHVAPTVLVAAVPVPDLLAGLRAAGFLPVEVSDDGSPVVAVRRLPGDPGAGGTEPSGVTVPAPPSRASALRDAHEQLHRWARRQAEDRRGGPPDAPPDPEEPDQAAERLVLGGPAPRTGDLPAVERRLRENGLRLRPAEVRQLAHALVHDLPVTIRYRSSSGGVTVRVVSELELTGGSLAAWCHLRQDQRFFTLSRLLSVWAVPGGS